MQLFKNLGVLGLLATGCQEVGVREVQYPPAVEILSPTDGGSAFADESIRFVVTAQDEDDPPESIVVTLRTDLQNDPIFAGPLPEERILEGVPEHVTLPATS